MGNNVQIAYNSVIKKISKLSSELENSGNLDISIKLEKIIKDSKKYLEKESRQQIYTGSIISIWAPKSVKDYFQSLDINNKISPEHLHMTLLYLGNSEEFEEKDKKEIINICKNKCEKQNPFKAKISGFGKFINEESDVLYASIDSIGLSEFRSDLIEDISSKFNIPNEHGFTPHMTIAYLKNKNAKLPNVESENLPSWRINNLTIAFGEEHFKLNLHKEES